MSLPRRLETNSSWRWASDCDDHELNPGVDKRFVVDLGWDAEDIAQ
jgi:hypothetical protein